MTAHIHVYLNISSPCAARNLWPASYSGSPSINPRRSRRSTAHRHKSTDIPSVRSYISINKSGDYRPAIVPLSFDWSPPRHAARFYRRMPSDKLERMLPVQHLESILALFCLFGCRKMNSVVGRREPDNKRNHFTFPLRRISKSISFSLRFTRYFKYCLVSCDHIFWKIENRM